MSQLFRRESALKIGDLAVTGLRVAFTIKKTLTKEPNTAEIRVWNLNADSRKRIGERHTPVSLSAGYRNSISIVFKGDARFISHELSGPDWITKIACGDGERALTSDRIQRSFGPGSPVAQVLSSIKTALGGLADGNFSQVVSGVTGVFENGFSASGDAFSVAEKIARGRGFNLSVQDGSLSLIPIDGFEAGTATLLTAETGLVGSPEVASPDKTGAVPKIKVRSLLQPSIRPGRLVDLRSAAISGLFRADAVEHKGDTHGPEWFTDVELKPT
jgi:hypothetical protein